LFALQRIIPGGPSRGLRSGREHRGAALGGQCRVDGEEAQARIVEQAQDCVGLECIDRRE
jgi:hypothetical protein